MVQSIIGHVLACTECALVIVVLSNVSSLGNSHRVNVICLLLLNQSMGKRLVVCSKADYYYFFLIYAALMKVFLTSMLFRYCMLPMWTISMDRRPVTTRWTPAGSKLSVHTLYATMFYVVYVWVVCMILYLGSMYDIIPG